MNARPTDVDGYLAALPPDAGATLEKLRQTIRAVAPHAVESISYGVAAFKYHGRPLVYLGAAKNHCALYGMSGVIAAHSAALAAYDTSKGTIRFPPGKPPPAALVRALVKARISEIEESDLKRRRTKSATRARARK